MDKWFSNDSLFINRDPYWYGVLRYIDIHNADRDLVAAEYQKYFDSFTKDKLTDISFGVYTQTSLVPSSAVEWMGDKYNWETEGGLPVDYKKDHCITCLWRLYRELDFDPVEMFIDTMKQHGIRPWLALRMNDVHHQTEPTHRMRSSLFYTAEEKGWFCGKDYEISGENKTLNYAIPEVRRMMTDYIAELFEKYDMFGIELDFMRNITCLDYKNDPDCYIYMTEFIRGVRALADASAKKWGHPVRLMLRIPRSPSVCRDFGFDVFDWVEKDYIDAFAPAPTFECSDSCIPVREWRELIGNKNIALFPSIEGHPINNAVMTTEMARAYAAAWYAQGADGFYPYNHFDPENPRDHAAWNLNRAACFGSGVRRFVLTFQDTYANPENRYLPFPFNLYWQHDMPIPVGPIAEDDIVTVTVDNFGPMPIMLFNGQKPLKSYERGPIYDLYDENGHPAEGAFMLSQWNVFSYEFTGLSTDCDALLNFRGTGYLLYLEITITRP